MREGVKDNNQPQNKEKKINDISEQRSKQALREEKKNYKMFAYPVLITPGSYLKGISA